MSARASHASTDDYSASFLEDSANGRARVEAALRERGIYVPLSHSVVWDDCAVARARRPVVVTDAAGQPAGTFTIDVTRSRAVPTHSLWRVPRFGPSLVAGAHAAALRFLSTGAQAERVLRVSVEGFATPQKAMSALGTEAANAGFRPASYPRGYTDTIRIPLDATEEALFARLHGTARRHIRSAAKHHLQVRLIDNERLAPRMEALLLATFVRTGGIHPAGTLAPIIALARHHPQRARVIGLFRSEHDDAEALLAFAVGYHHGDHVEYATAASDRPADVRAPLGYALAWDLIRWARNTGAAWFDFGGVTGGTHADVDDPKGGITDFKRYFSTNVVNVGAEWELDPHPLATRLATVVSFVADAFSG